MKIISTQNYHRNVFAQVQTLEEEPLNQNIVQPALEVPIEEPTMQKLPVIRREDLTRKLEDDIEETTGIIEPQPIEKNPKGYPQFKSNIQTLQWAEQNREVVQINYTTESGRNITRNVEPHGQFHARTTHRQILVTFDVTINDIRAFIIHNVHKVIFTGEDKFNKKFNVSRVR